MGRGGKGEEYGMGRGRAEKAQGRGMEWVGKGYMRESRKGGEEGEDIRAGAADGDGGWGMGLGLGIVGNRNRNGLFNFFVLFVLFIPAVCPNSYM
jgi:hypothetical protein